MSGTNPVNATLILPTASCKSVYSSTWVPSSTTRLVGILK
jgi:hypothetical protein